MNISVSKMVAGAVALAFAGSAMANVSLDGSTTGDLFLNIVNETNNTSYIFDTGVAFANFNGNSSYNFNLSSDSILTSFLATGGTFDFSVAAGTNVGGNKVDVTGNVAPSINSATKTGTARGAIGTFVSQAGTVTSASAAPEPELGGSDGRLFVEPGRERRRRFQEYLREPEYSLFGSSGPEHFAGVL